MGLDRCSRIVRIRLTNTLFKYYSLGLGYVSRLANCKGITPGITPVQSRRPLMRSAVTGIPWASCYRMLYHSDHKWAQYYL